MHTIKTDVLIVGTGPAGASLACFLAYHGITGLMISQETHTAPQPRAHITNMGTWECFRDIDLEQELREISLGKEYYGDFRYCSSLTGEDLVRIRSFGREPERLADYEEASPCSHADISQNDLEPFLNKYATLHGFQSRMSCEFLHYTESGGLVSSTIRDRLTNENFQVVSKYLCGADGANSKVAAQAGLNYNRLATFGSALNVWFEADLSRIFEKSPGFMTTIFNPHIEHAPSWGAWGICRVVRPYSEFMVSMIAQPGLTSIPSITDAEAIKRLHELIGDDSVSIKIKGMHRWRFNEAYAETARKDNVFCLGDAIHAHSPAKGLGANTSMQDAYNLAWKLAYVLKGKADAKLLDSYDSERQPVARYVVHTANQTIHDLKSVTDALGVFEETYDERMAAMKELGEATDRGKARRAAYKAARHVVFDETHALGAEMNQAYRSSAVYTDDEDPDGDRYSSWPQGPEGVQHHFVSTSPGARLPHAWLGTGSTNARISTHDVAGKGRFTLFTGVGGADVWTAAVESAAQALGGGVEIALVSIGFGQQYSDVYFAWDKHRGVDDDGAVLVRPDRTVAWRCKTPATLADPASKLTAVMRRILGRD